MMFPNDWEKFLEDYSFKDKEEVYTNGSMLIPVFRVEQMVEHYFGSKWIPVSDRLPGVFKAVIVWTEYHEIGEAQYNGKHFQWIDDEGDYEYAHVTHWMPLPNPPKGE
jgi:hypothetical protein